MCLGHESSGIVAALGPNAGRSGSGLKVGSRVALEPGVVCRVCDACKTGQYEVSLVCACAGAEVEVVPQHDLRCDAAIRVWNAREILYVACSSLTGSDEQMCSQRICCILFQTL